MLLFVITTSCFPIDRWGKKTMKDFVGIYYYKRLYDDYSIIDYLILKNDSTYRHVYVNGEDTIMYESKWKFFKSDKNHWSFEFYSWLWMEKESSIPWHESGKEAYRIPPFYYTPYVIGFNPDDDEHFWRIDSVDAIKLCIKEDSVVWKME